MDTTTKSLEKEPLVSILMLTYNRAKYIGAAIESVLNQTYQNFELVIIDDGSTDNTQEILDRYDDPRIAVITYPANAGLLTRRKESLTYAQGTYTAILDSDDVWTSPDKLATQVAYMEDNPECDVLGTYIALIDAQGAEIGHTRYHTNDSDIRKNILHRNQFAHSSILMRTAAVAQTNGYQDTALAEDYDLFLQLGLHGRFANIPEEMTAYRIHTESFNSQKVKMATAVLNIITQYKNQYPHYYRALFKAYIRILLAKVRT